jgi:hypothetical protein
MQVTFNDWKCLAVVVGGLLLLVIILSGQGNEVLAAVVEAIHALRQ